MVGRRVSELVPYPMGFLLAESERLRGDSRYVVRNGAFIWTDPSDCHTAGECLVQRGWHRSPQDDRDVYALPGLYAFFFDNGDLAYLGGSGNVATRLARHEMWSRIPRAYLSVRYCDPSESWEEIESALLRRLQPPLNAKIPRTRVLRPVFYAKERRSDGRLLSPAEILADKSHSGMVASGTRWRFRYFNGVGLSGASFYPRIGP